MKSYLEAEEARKVIAATWEVSKHPLRDSLILELLWQSGCRVTEALTLMPERIGLTSVGLHNLKQRDKDAIKEVEVSRELCDRLRAFCDSNHIGKGNWVFQANRKNSKGHLSRVYAWRVVTKAAEQSRVFKLGKKTRASPVGFRPAWCHLFRHGNAMHLLECTEDISLVAQQLGHASVVTTQGYAYTKKPKIRKKVAEIKW